MKTFTIEPYVGPLPLRFGMTPEEVERELGPPTEVSRGPLANRVEWREHVSLGYSAGDNRLTSAVFSRGVELYLYNHSLLDHSDPISLLRKYDPVPYEWVGFIIFLELGIRVSGFHDNDESQKAIGVVRKGYWDEFLEDFVPYEPRPADPDGNPSLPE